MEDKEVACSQEKATLWLFWIFRHCFPKDIARLLASQEVQWWGQGSTIQKIRVSHSSQLAPANCKWMVTGNNFHGQLGLCHQRNVNTWTELVPPVPFVLISPSNTHTIALASDGNVWGWGYNGGKQLGIEEVLVPQPTKLPCPDPISNIAAGTSISMFVARSGKVYMCGIGVNSQTQYPPMKHIFAKIDIEKAIQIQCNADHCLCLTKEGTMYSWGANKHGQLGLGDIKNYSSPQKVPNVSNICDIQIGFESSYCVSKNGNLFSWGRNDCGQLGLKNATNQKYPTLVPLPAPVKQVSVGLNHVLCLSLDGKVYSWGQNYEGQLATGNTLNKNCPIEAETRNDKIGFVKASGNFSFYVSESKELYGWGEGKNGQLGVGESLTLQHPFSAHVAAGPYLPINANLKNVVAAQLSSQTSTSFFAVINL